MESRFTGADVKEMWETGFIPVDLLDPVGGTDKCTSPDCTDHIVYQVGFPNFCFQHALGWHSLHGNPDGGDPYIPIAERTPLA